MTTELTIPCSPRRMQMARSMDTGMHIDYTIALEDELATILQEDAKLREALAFYAQDRNYWEDYQDSIWRTTAIAEDRGKRARAALSDLASEYPGDAEQSPARAEREV